MVKINISYWESKDVSLWRDRQERILWNLIFIGMVNFIIGLMISHTLLLVVNGIAVTTGMLGHISYLRYMKTRGTSS